MTPPSPDLQTPSPSRALRRLTWLAAPVLAALATLTACGGGGGGGSDGGQPQAIVPGTDRMATLSLEVREGQASPVQTVVVPSTGVVGTYSWDVLPGGANVSSARLVPGGVELLFTVPGVTGWPGGASGPEIEVRFCNAAPCTSSNSLRRILPVQLNVLRGLSWQPPAPLLFGGQGLPLAEQRVEIGVPSESGTLEVEVLPVPGRPSDAGWLVATVDGGSAGAGGATRSLRLSVPTAATLPLGEYDAQLRARYVFSSAGTAPLELGSQLQLQVRPPGCRLPESRPGTPPTLGDSWGPRFFFDEVSTAIRIECWGIAPADASFQPDVPWLRASTRRNLGELEVVIALDAAQAAGLPPSLSAERQLRIGSPVQAADTVIPFTLNIRFADVRAVSPAVVRAGVAAEVELSGDNLDSQLPLVLYNAAGQPVPGVSLNALRLQGCDVGGCEVVVAVPALAAGDWYIGVAQPPGVVRPRGLLRVTGG